MKIITKDSDENIEYFLVFRRICIIILVVTAVYFLLVNFLSPYCDRNETRGTFGDLFGGLNAVFSGFAFAGVIITILMQMKELELTRTELRKSATAQDKSQKALNSQLKQMQLTSEIESVKNVIDIYGNRNEQDKKEIAKVVLEKLTEQIFYNEKFADYTKPDLSISVQPKLQGKKVNSGGYVKYEQYNKAKVNHIVIRFKNTGASFRFNPKIASESFDELNISIRKVIVKTGNGGTKTSYDKLIDGSLVERNSEVELVVSKITKEQQIILEFDYTGDFVNHQWVQYLYLNFKGAKVEPEFEPIQRKENG